jgi:hypothetical protein
MTTMSEFTDVISWWEVLYGTKSFEHEDDWGWTFYGHPPRRRVLAVVNKRCRLNGVHHDLREAIDWDVDNIVIERKLAANLREESDGYRWDWVGVEIDKSEPMTVVTLR